LKIFQNSYGLKLKQTVFSDFIICISERLSFYNAIINSSILIFYVGFEKSTLIIDSS